MEAKISMGLRTDGGFVDRGRTKSTFLIHSIISRSSKSFKSFSIKEAKSAVDDSGCFHFHSLINILYRYLTDTFLSNNNDNI